MKKLTKNDKYCLISILVILIKFVLILFLKSRAEDSQAVVGNNVFRSVLYYYPVLYGIIFYLLIFETTTFINASFKKFARKKKICKIIRIFIWISNIILCCISIVDLNDIAIYSFKSVYLRLLQFAALGYTVISLFTVKEFKERPAVLSGGK